MEGWRHPEDADEAHGADAGIVDDEGEEAQGDERQVHHVPPAEAPALR
jgi:hypothetical protein